MESLDRHRRIGPVGLIPRGAAAGAVTAALGTLLYLLIFAGYGIASDLTAHGNPADAVPAHGNPVVGVAALLWLGC